MLRRVDSLICTHKKEQSSSITLKSHNGSCTVDQAELFAFDKFTLQNLANKSRGVFYKQTFCTFYTSHLR